MFTDKEKDVAVGRYTKSTDPDQVARWKADGESVTMENVGRLVRNCDPDQYDRVLEYIHDDLVDESIARHEQSIDEQDREFLAIAGDDYLDIIDRKG